MSAASRCCSASTISSKWTDPELLLALDDQLEVERELAADGEHGLHRLEVHPHLALVVNRTARVELAVTNLGVEGGRPPFFERIDRLDVVVSIDERRRQFGIDHPLGVDGGVALRLDELAVLETGGSSRDREVLRVATDVRGVRGIGGDARDAEELDELVHVALLVGGAVRVQIVLRHAGSLVWRPLGLHPL